MDVKSIETGESLKNTTELTAPGARLGVKKKITLSDSYKDFQVEVYEDGKLLTTWKVTGLEEKIAGEFKHLMEGDNKTSPKVAFTIG